MKPGGRNYAPVELILKRTLREASFFVIRYSLFVEVLELFQNFLISSLTI